MLIHQPLFWWDTDICANMLYLTIFSQATESITNDLLMASDTELISVLVLVDSSQYL